MTEFGECSSCREPIRWAYTVNNKKIPLNVEPYERGNVLVSTINGRDVATVLSSASAAKQRDQGTVLYVSHFVTCPAAAHHRKRR